MTLSAAAARREEAAKKVEAQRQALLKETNCDDDTAVAEFIQIGGGTYKKSTKIAGAYQRIVEKTANTVLYQRLDPNSCDFCPLGPFLEFGAHGARWKITDAPGSKKAHARNADASQCPARIEKAWEVYSSSASGFVEDVDLRIVEIPLGFCLIAPPTHDKEVERLEEGPAAGCEILACLEQDESQIRRLSPRGYFHFPDRLGGHQCRGKKDLKRHFPKTLDEGVTDDLLTIYNRLKNTLMSRVAETYFYFHPCSPTLFYRKTDSELQVPDVSVERSSSSTKRTKPSLPKPAALQAIEDDIIAREEDGDRPIEPIAKRRRIEKQEVNDIGSAQDPFMKNVSRDDPIPTSTTSGRPANETQARGTRAEVSAIAADFRALKRLDPKARERILTEATWTPWYSELVKMGTVKNDATDEQLNEIWVWCIASDCGKEFDLHAPRFLSQLALKSMRGAVDRLRPVLARLLCLSETLSYESLILDITMDLLSESDLPAQETIEHEIAVLRSGKTLSTLRLAKNVFKPGAKPIKQAKFWQQSLVCFAFGIVYSGMHLLPSAGTLDICSLLKTVHNRLNADIGVIVWVRLAALYLGIAAPLREFGSFCDLPELSLTAPKALARYLKKTSPDDQTSKRADMVDADAQLNEASKSQAHQERQDGKVGQEPAGMKDCDMQTNEGSRSQAHQDVDQGLQEERKDGKVGQKPAGMKDGDMRTNEGSRSEAHQHVDQGLQKERNDGKVGQEPAGVGDVDMQPNEGRRNQGHQDLEQGLHEKRQDATRAQEHGSMKDVDTQPNKVAVGSVGKSATKALRSSAASSHTATSGGTEKITVATVPQRIAGPRQVDIYQLRPGILAGAWYLVVQVLGKTPFQTGSGFQATFGDVSGDTIVAFFFRESALKHEASVRVGLRLLLTPASILTHVRKADAKYGGRLQLIVGKDASISTEQFRLGRLPYTGSVEVFGVISWASEMIIARNGIPYRKVLLVDETCFAGVDWFCWGHFATSLPDVLDKRTLVHIKGADVASQLGKRRHIRNGEASFPQDSQYDDRMKELMEWSQQCIR